jgi:DGQHR domain-containing protein
VAVRKRSATRSTPAVKPAQRVRAAVNLVTQGENRFYTLSLYSRVLSRTCFVSRRSDDPKRGFQRLLDESRAKNIAKYIEEGGSIPTSIVLSAQPQAELKIVGGKTLEFNDVPKAFLVLDGQHRVFGFSLTDFDLRVPVVIYNKLSRQQEVRLFIDINTNQKAVPNALLLDIRRLAGYQTTEEEFLSELFDTFNSSGDSPLIGLLSVGAGIRRTQFGRVKADPPNRLATP